ncbi:MAG: hypothetical protein AAF557_13935 [Pseudomonadota bacterium]
MTDLTGHFIRAVSLTLLAALAACADGGQESETPAAEASNSQTAAASNSQTAAAATGQGQQGQDRVNLAQCTQDTNGRVFFQVGATTMSIPAPSVRDAIPSSLNPPINKEAVRKELQSQAAAGGGCPGKPIAASLLILQDDLGHPLLDGRIGLLGTPPEGVTAQFSQVTRNLQQNPTENCRDLGGDLLGCVGTETRGNAQTQVMYVIARDPGQRMASGGPLAARCVLKESKVQGCNLVDQLPGNVAFDATLKAGTYTTDGLRAAREAAAAKVNSYRTR